MYTYILFASAGCASGYVFVWKTAGGALAAAAFEGRGNRGNSASVSAACSSVAAQ